MGGQEKLKTPSFLLVAPFSPDSIFLTCDLNLDMRFVLILNYKHVKTAGLTVQVKLDIVSKKQFNPEKEQVKLETDGKEQVNPEQVSLKTEQDNPQQIR
jgi:hypothetical protein